MKKIISMGKLIPFILWGGILVYSVLCVTVPHLAYADNSVQNGLGRISEPFGGAGSRWSSGNVFDLLTTIIKIMLGFAGAIAVLFVIIGGFQYVTSAGNAEQAEKGRATVINAIIGIVIIVLSYVIINVIVNTVQCSTNGGFGGLFSSC